MLAREERVTKQVTKHKAARLVDHIDEFGKKLTDWEKKFISSLKENPPKEFSEKQITVIERIYDEKC